MVETNFKVVVLPLPLGPNRTKTFPEATLREISSRARVSPLRSLPIQLNRAGRWRKTLLTDSSAMLSIGLRRLEALYYSWTLGVSPPNPVFKDSTATKVFPRMPLAASRQPIPRATPEVQRKASSIFNPEFDLLLACCTNRSDIEGAERIRETLTRPLDWKRVINLAEHHCV